ncbi:MAG: hypothetical protein Hyperionvirus1_61 [Hyperionvirus sp.]|uniref:Protein kinase domain-containing protein n=1 Tax=Hyperionvirus sp. TaxID=2487770 RepID=A0A3G5A629_9VIRU|nr:MAG: hypothetical protein Hyperionvirus1_61 [Hyperionvirus sp.]
MINYYKKYVKYKNKYNLIKHGGSLNAKHPDVSLPQKKHMFVTNKLIGAGDRESRTRVRKIIESMNYTTTTELHLISEDASVAFKFDELMNNQLLEDTYKYLGRGSYTAVFGIKQSEKMFVLKIIMTNPDPLVEKYMLDKKLLPLNIPDILYYGKLTIFDRPDDLYYIISPYYDTKFSILSFANKKKLLSDLLNSLIYLNTLYYFIGDLKLDNLGFDHEFNYVIIDYDMNTLTKYRTAAGYLTFKSTGTYTPLYALNSESAERFDKIDTLALADIIFSLFFTKLNKGGQYIKTIDALYFEKNVALNKDKLIILPGRGRSHVVSVSNLSNLPLIKAFIASIKCLDSIDPANCLILKTILINDNGGLLHYAYDKIPSYSDILKLIFSMNAISI